MYSISKRAQYFPKAHHYIKRTRFYQKNLILYKYRQIVPGKGTDGLMWVKDLHFLEIHDESDFRDADPRHFWKKLFDLFLHIAEIRA